jgi:hypothetical protein
MAFDRWVAENYERLWPELFDPAVLDPAVDLLAELAAGGPAPAGRRWSSASARAGSPFRCTGAASRCTASTSRRR